MNRYDESPLFAIDCEKLYKNFDEKKELRCIGEFLEGLTQMDLEEYIGEALIPSKMFQIALLSYLFSQSDEARNNLIEVVKKSLTTALHEHAREQHFKNCMVEDDEEDNYSYIERTQGLRFGLRG